MSACLPGVIVPILWSSAQARAPSIVANSRTSRCVSVGANAVSGVSVNARIRSCTSAVRICVNISPGTLETTSMLNDGRTPRATSRPVGGTPCPINISTNGATDADPPDCAMRSSSSSVESVQWM